MNAETRGYGEEEKNLHRCGVKGRTCVRGGALCD